MIRLKQTSTLFVINKWLLKLFFTAFFVLPHFHSDAQFIRLQLELEDEVTLEASRPFQFGSIPVNYGWVQIGMNDELAGRIVLRTMENINLLVSVNAPEQLIKDQNNVMPLDIRAAYYNSIPERNPNPIEFEGATARFQVNDSGKLVEQMDRRRERLESTIYIYGSVFAGRIEPGVYRGTVIVRIEYE